MTYRPISLIMGNLLPSDTEITTSQERVRRAKGALTSLIFWLLVFQVFVFLFFSKVLMIYLLGCFSRKSLFFNFVLFQRKLLEHEKNIFYNYVSSPGDEMYRNGTLRIDGKYKLVKGTLPVFVIKMRLRPCFYVS